MSGLCEFDGDGICIRCGYDSRKRKVWRNCPQAGEDPAAGLFSRVSRYAAALGKWIGAGRPERSDEQVTALLEICRACPKYDHARQSCNLCGCKANKYNAATMNKLRMATESCPLDPPRWVATECHRRGERPRVGFVVPHMMWGGVEQWLAMLAEQLPRHGVDVSGIAAFGRADTISPDVVDLMSRHCPVVTTAAGDVRMTMGHETVYAVAQGADVLVVWSVGGMILHACRATGLPLIGVSHGCGDWWMRAAAPYIDHWVAVSQQAREPIPADRVAVIHNGVDVERARRVTISREEMRREAGVPLGARVVVSIGRIAPEKRLHLLSGALDRLPSDVWLWLVGSGTERERAKIIDAAGRSAERLVITGPRDDIGNVLAAADCFGFTSQSEGYGLAPVEAMAAGVPLVATPVGVLPDFAGAAELLPLDPTVGQVADAILAVLPRVAGDGTTRSMDVLQRAYVYRHIVAARHSAEAMAKAWAKFLTEVTRASNSSPDGH